MEQHIFTPHIETNALQIDMVHHAVALGHGTYIDLTPRETQVVAFLHPHIPRRSTELAMMLSIYDANVDGFPVPTTPTIEPVGVSLLVHSLRGKLGQQAILTGSHGYVINETFIASFPQR